MKKMSDVNGGDEEPPHSSTLHTPQDSFTLIDDPFAHHHPGTVPVLVEDFSGVHPDISWDNISALDFFFSMFNAFLYVERLTILCLLAFIGNHV